MRTTTATVNKIFKARGIDFTMYRGNGYYYFMSPTTDINSLYENSISNDDPEEIVQYAINNSGDKYSAR
jgi:hypothetical protein